MAVREVGNLRTRLSFDDKGATSSLQRFRQDLAGLRSEMRTVTAMGKGYTNSLRGLRQQQDILNRQMRTHQERVKELNRRYQEAVKAKGEDSEEARKLARQYNNAQAEMLRTEQQLKRVTQAIEAQQNPWKRLSRQLDQTGDRLRSFGQGMRDFGRSYTMHVTAPIVAGGTAIFKAAMDYESAFAGVRKTVDATEEELAQLSQGIRDLAKELPASAVEIAGVAEAAGQLGIETENILSFTRTMIDLGEATNLTAEQAATEFARFANIVGMSQKDFDRLGSTVVALGNNFATTEREIVEMAMRLAGAGNQVGLTEAQIMAFATALSSVGIEAEMGGSAFSRVMVEIANASANGEKAIKVFADVAGMSAKDFQKAFEEDASKAIIAFIKGLDRMSKEGENVFGVLEDLGLSEIRVRDTLLRAAGAADVFTDAIELGSEAWKENTALTEEAEERYKTTESQLRMMWNRIKDVAIQLGGALAPAIMDALDAAEPFIKSIEDGAKAFSEMDKEQQRSILKMIAFVAAAGPVTMVLGNITSGIGSFLKLGSGLSDILGKEKGGTGLLSRIASLGPLGVGGLAVGGVTLLATGVYHLTKDMRKLHDVSTETADAMMDQYLSNIEIIDSFEELRRKSQLTNDEFKRYLDLQSRLQSETDPESIELIQRAIDKLQEKSGLSNEELSKMVEYNNTLTKTIPEATSEITEQGNRVADTTDKLREYNQEIANMAKRELEAELQKSLANEIELREQIKEIELEINSTLEREEMLRGLIKAHNEGTLEQYKEKLQDEYESVEQAYREAVARGEVTDELSNQRKNLEDLLAMSDMDIEKAREALAIAIEHTEEQRELLKEKEADLNKTGEIVAKMVEYELIAAGINEEKAKLAVKDAEVSSLLNEQLQALEDQKKELESQTPPAMRMTEEYKAAKQQIDDQISKLKIAKGNIEDLISEAGEYNSELSKDIKKNIDAEMNPSADEINKKAAVEVKKKIRFIKANNIENLIPSAVRVAVNFATRRLPGFAEGTDYAPGGPAIVGEEGPELIRHRNKWALADFGLIDLPRGAQVFTHDETKRILGALNRIPAYADGVSPAGEVDRIINRLNKSEINEGDPVVIELHITNNMDGRAVGEVVEKHVTRIQQRKQFRQRRLSNA